MTQNVNTQPSFIDSKPTLIENLKQNWKVLTIITAVLAIGIGGFIWLRSTVKQNTGLAEYTRSANLMRSTNYSTGKADASLKIVYAFDFLCPACQSNTPNMKQLVDKYEDRVKFVFKPFVVHAGTGDLAAQAAQAAGRQGKYYQYYEKLMNLIIANNGASSNSVLKQAAKETDLDFEQWDRERGNVEIEQEISFDQRDIREANFEIVDSNGNRRPTGTPSLVVVKDERVVSWWTGIKSVEEISGIIDQNL